MLRPLFIEVISPAASGDAVAELFLLVTLADGAGSKRGRSDVIEDPPLLPNTLFDIAGGKRGIEVVVEDCSLPTEVGFGLLILYFLSVISSTVRASLLLIFFTMLGLKRNMVHVISLCLILSLRRQR